MEPRARTRAASARSWRALNPPATVADQLRGRVVFDTLARRYADQGAIAVVLGGSWARGEAHRASDIDMWVLGRRSGHQTYLRDGFQVHVERTTERTERRRLRDPRRVGGSVPGWRSALLVYDPTGVAARIQVDARRFQWSTIATRCDRWVANEVAGSAEEAIKLIRALGEGSLETAAVQRNFLAGRMALVLAVHRRILYGTENELWERVGRRVGGPWEAAQRAALGVPRGDVVGSCCAALELYRLTATAVRRTFLPEQADLVGEAATLIRACLASAPRA